MEHFIKNIEITNFKSMRHAAIKDCRRVNVFVGYPNVGKSNILEAMSLFSLVQDINLVKFKDLVRVTNDPTLFFNGNLEKKLEVAVNDNFKIEGKYRNGDIDFSVLNLRQTAPLTGWESPGDVIDSLLLNTTTYRNFEFSRSDGRQSENKNFKNFPRTKKYDFKKNTDIVIGDYDILTYPFGNNLFSVIQSNSSIRKDIYALLKSNDLEMLFDSSYQKFSIFKRTDVGIFSVDYELIADTLQRIIFYKTALLSNRKTILLLEEPESHLFPPYISQLTSDIIQDKNQNQFFIATHSPFVLNDFMEDLKDDELSIYAVGLENGETTINRMTDEQVTEAYQYGIDLFFNLENYLKPEELVKQ